MNRPIELIGWDEIIIRPEAILSLSSRALKVYQYLLMVAQRAESSHPTVEKIVKDLNEGCPEETWSEPTVKRATLELTEKKFAYRARRLKKSSTTYLFKSSKEGEEFIRRITDDLTVGSPVIRHTTTTIPSDEETKSRKLFVMYEKAFGYSPLFYDIGLLDELGDEYELGFIEAAFKEAVRMNVRKLAYVSSVCEKAKESGRLPGDGKGAGDSGKPQEESSEPPRKVLR
jgi:hypothetical protein